MPLSELLPPVSQLSHQDKLRLIHFLLLAVAKEEGCSLEPDENSDSESALLNSHSVRETSACAERLCQRLAATEAVVWSPQSDLAAVQALSDLLVAAKGTAHA
jgi:hypothetical protein